MPSFDFAFGPTFTEASAMGAPGPGCSRAPAEQCVMHSPPSEEPSTQVTLPCIQTAPVPPQVLVQVLVNGPDGQQLTLPLQSSDTIRELKMLLANKSWFTSKHCLFFGDKELLDNTQVADVVCQVQHGNENYLHVFVKAKDVRFGSIATATTSVSFGNLQQLDDGNLTPPGSLERRSSIQSQSGLGDESSTALALIQQQPGANSELASAVLHIVIRKNSHVSWSQARSGEFQLTVRSTDTASQLKQQLLPPSTHDGFHSIVSDIDVFHKGIRLQADRPLLEYGLNDGDVLDIVPWEPTASIPPVPADKHHTIVPVLSSPSHRLNLSWQRAMDGLRAGIAPELAPSGSGGSYFLYDSSRTVVAVFKPNDEEPNMPNNPRGLALSPSSLPVSPGTTPPREVYVRRGVLPGEGAYREVAAYLLDHSNRAGVPATAPVHMVYPDGSAKHGSLQEFVRSDNDCEEMGYSMFTVEEVHKIAVLDLRLANADRNGSNILARREGSGTWTLIPIDHAYCLPSEWCDMSFGWSMWRQAKVPFDDSTREYIMHMDPEKDLAMLADRGIVIRPECARVFKAADMLLKKVAIHGLSPRDAADILERKTLRKSTMEKMHRVATERAARQESERQGTSLGRQHSMGSTAPAVNGGSDDVYLKHLAQLVEEYLADLHSDTALGF